MPKRRQSDLEGFEVFKALNRAQEQAKKKKKRKAPPPGEEDRQQKGSKVERKRVASNIGHTALPPKHNPICFECGYTFEISGNVKSIQCPKCKVEISLRNVTVGGEWHEDVKTGGKIHIEKDAVVDGCTLIARNMVLEGRLKGGTFQAFDSLRLLPTGEFNEDCIEVRNLVVEPNARITLKHTRKLHSIDIRGSITASDLTVETSITIHAGALLKGNANAERLIVEEGGGLKGNVRIQSENNSADGREENTC